MQKTSIEDISIFLNNESWGFDGAKANQSYQYFKYPLNYNIVEWEKSSYSNGKKIILYNYPNKPNIVIYQTNSTCFNELINNFSLASKGIIKIENNVLITFFRENSITIEFREYKNDYSSKQYSILFYNSNALEQEIRSEKNKEEAIEKARIEKENKYIEAISAGDKLFNIEKYEDAKIQYVIANEIDSNGYIQEKLDKCNQSICDEIIAQADIQFENNNLQNAIDLYSKAKSFSKSEILIEGKITSVKEKILENAVNEKLELGNLNYNEKKFDLAKEVFKAALQLDPNNLIAIEKIKSIDYIKEILDKRKTTVFSYKTINTHEFNNLKNNLLKEVNNNINKTNNGLLTFDLQITFDTTGKKQVLYNNYNSSIKTFENSLIDIINTPLSPTIKAGYFLASKEHVIINSKWVKEKISFKSSKNGINEIGQSNIEKRIFEKYISDEKYRYGKFIFDVKTKISNENTFTDINLIGHRSTAGPLNVLQSLLMPGMGTLKVSNGRKGWGRFALFLISSGITIGSKIYSNQQYKSYLSASNQTSIDKYYNNANVSNKIALVSGGLTTAIYLHDIIWVFSKGLQNSKKSQYLKKQLSGGPVPIQYQPIIIE